MKVLYIYSGTRKDRFNGQIGVDYPDTQFYGLNYLKEFDIEACHKEPSLILKKIFGFRVAHAFLFFSSFGYDVVFGSSLMYVLLWRKLFKTKTKYVLLNISLNRTISANKEKKFKSAILMWLLKELDAVVCLSVSQKKYLEEKVSFLRGKVFYIPLGVDILYNKPVYDDRDNFILSAGRDNGRDYKTVMDVARLMDKEKFHIVASDRNFKDIKNIPDNVELFFDIPFDKLSEKYKKAKILLLITKPDDYVDGSDCSGQTVLLDAMASGLPIVASPKIYIGDYACDGEDISLADFYDAVSIKNKIELLESKSTRKSLAKNARDKVENNFSTKDMARKLSELFYKLNYITSFYESDNKNSQ